MRHLLRVLVLAVLVLGAGWFVATLPGQVAISFGRYAFAASVPVTLLLVAVLFGAMYLLLRLIGGVFTLPRRLRRARMARGRRLGDIAITRTLVALAAGDGAVARTESARARRLLGDQPYTLLLTAQAAHLNGREDEADEAFRLLAARDDAGFLGLRGLLRQAMRRGDWDGAAALAQRAEAVHPGAAWLRGTRAELALRTGAWHDALRLSVSEDDSGLVRPALAAAASEQTEDREEGRRLARQAFEADPTLTPAALAYVARLREFGIERKATDVLRRAWTANPHPNLADAYLVGVTDPLLRVQSAARLVKSNPDHLESRLLLARLSLDANLPGEARRHIQAARTDGANQRRVWRLLSAVAAQDGTDPEAALHGLAEADPDPTWHCTACHAPQPRWTPVCPNCGAAGRVAWASVGRVGNAA